MNGVTTFVISNIPAAVAKPAPNLGSIFGRLGLNMASFCQEFNSRTAAIYPGTPLRVTVTVFPNRNIKFVPHTPPTTWFLRRLAGSVCGKRSPGHGKAIGCIQPSELFKVALIKTCDPAFVTTPLRSIYRQLLGTARTMGIIIRCNVPVRLRKRRQLTPSIAAAIHKDLRQKRKFGKRK